MRIRVALAFGMVSVVVTGTVAYATWRLSSSYMLEQREQSAVRQAMVNARIVESEVARNTKALPELLTGLGSDVESAVLLVDNGQWISSGNVVSPQRLPSPLLSLVGSGHVASQRLNLGGAPVLAVGLPIPDAAATFVEVFPLRELDRSLRYISWMLLFGVAVSGFAGAVLGRWASGRALRPLSSLTAAAAAVAEGELHARLPQTRDRDLAPLAVAFNETTQRLQDRVTSDAHFAADVSHELRSPLTTMLNAMSVLRRRRSQLTGSAGQALDLLDDELVRFQRMVTDLLEISLTDVTSTSVELEAIDLAELVGQATRHHSSVVELPDHHVRVLADRRRLERALANLVTNAEQHGHGLVRLAVLERDGRARIEVDDAGPGIDAADRQRIFERFARIRAADRIPKGSGAGLGLALVARHVRLHQGQVWTEPRPGGGARFVIELARVPS